MNSSYQVQCGSFALSVSVSATAEVIDELGNYLVRASAARTPDLHMEVVLDPGFLERFDRRQWDLLRQVVYKPDVRYEWLTARSDGQRLLRPAEPMGKPGHALLPTGASSWRIVIGQREQKREAIRFLRSWLRALLRARGFACVHAGLFLVNGRDGVLVVGDSGSGKTTTVWEACLLGHSYVSNDRVLLSGAQGVGVGLPTAVRLGRGLVDCHRELLNAVVPRRTLDDGHWFYQRPMPVASEEHWGEQDKLELTPLEIATASGAPWAAAGPIGAVLVSSLSPTGARARVRPATLDEVSAIIDRNIREPVDPDYPEDYFEFDTLLASSSRALGRLWLNRPIYLIEGHPADARSALSSWLGGS